MTYTGSEVYHSYLLRIWRESNHGHPEWRASLHCVQTSNWYNFMTLSDLYAFLNMQTSPGPSPEQEWGPK
ncbi:MAG: hypothetical protein ACK2UO_08660 [Caldilineaceae bacterium]|jgi:hypothetical protein